MDLVPIDTPNPTQEIYIFNPTKEDFTHPYLGVPYTIPSYEGKRFPKDLADHLAKHLANKITGEMPGVITDSMREKVLSGIYMNDWND